MSLTHISARGNHARLDDIGNGNYRCRVVEEEIITIVRTRGSVALDRAISQFGFKIRDLAERIGVPHPYIVDWRKGRSVPTEEQKAKLEEVFAKRVNGRVVMQPDGSVESAVPREWWTPLAQQEAA